MDGVLYEETHEFLKHALVECSFGFPTPIIFLRVWCEPSVWIPQS